MKKLILIIPLFITLMASAQFGKDEPYLPLHKVSLEFSTSGMMSNTYWDLCIHYRSNGEALTTAESMIDTIDSYINYKSSTTHYIEGKYYYIKQYRNNLNTLFSHYKLLGSDESGKFYCAKSEPSPLFALANDSGLTLIIQNACIEKVLNTLKLTPKQRATKVIVAYILPALRAYDKSFSDDKIKYFGFCISYGSKDFSDDGSTTLKPEWVSVISPTKSIRQYAANEISEDEFINQSEVYVLDRDMSGGAMKKIKITIE